MIRKKRSKARWQFWPPAATIALLLGASFPVVGQNVRDCPNCSLQGKDFSGQDLSNVNFNGANLDGANFSGATLKGAMFVNASLVKANFTNAILDQSTQGPANFSNADLTSAVFTKAVMTHAVLSYANVTGTNFTGADLSSALPGLQLRYSFTGPASVPSFDGAKLSCDFRPFMQVLDLSAARFNCMTDARTVDTTRVLQYTAADLPEDRTKPVRVTVVSSVPDTTGNKRGYTDTHERKQTKAGVAGDTVYVTTAGTDNSTCGSYSSPCKTIGQGVTNARANGIIYVDYGQYTSGATVAVSKSLTIVGGCIGGKPTSYQSMVTAPANGLPAFTVSGSGVTLGLSNFLLNGSDATTQNQASMVLQAMSGSKLQLRSVNVNAARGAQGASGNTPGVGAAGGKGNAGSNGTGGAGGTAACGGNNGGIGANRTSKVSDNCVCGFLCATCTAEVKWYKYTGGSGQPGSTGVWAAGSAGADGVNYQCPSKERPPNAAAGNNGKNAGCGGSGNPSANQKGSYSVGGQWTAAISGDGGGGGNGGGGGGGGSGGMCHYCNCVCGGTGDYNDGTAGGGGGAGGCGASGGRGGAQGGASFGIVLQAATIVADNSVKITSATGGNGGNGGGGNSGGAGGEGGSGQPSGNVCNGTGSQGGTGGKGGAGGASGGGAGGNGGPAIGIAMVGSCTVTGAPIYYQGQSGAVGSGGNGGTQATGSCTGAGGNKGNPGTVSNTIQF